MTDTITMIRLPVDLKALWKLDAERGWSGDVGTDEGLALHHVLGETYGGGVVQPFRLLVPPRKTRGTLYGYTTDTVEMLKQHAQLAPPGGNEPFPGEVEHKELPLRFEPGRRLGFDIKLRPVRRVKNAEAGDRNSGREIDVFQHEARAHAPKEEPDDMNASGRTREKVYVDWLAERLDGAASLDTETGVSLAHFRRSRVVRNGRAVEGPDAVLQGTLRVTDPEAFARLMSQGIGRHRAYGYGMILLRPPGRAAPRE